ARVGRRLRHLARSGQALRRLSEAKAARGRGRRADRDRTWLRLPLPRGVAPRDMATPGAYEADRYRWSVNDEQKPLELILARNLLSSISTPGFLVDKNNELVFFNEAAGSLLGKRFEEIGRLPFEEWSAMFGPLDDAGAPIPAEALPLVIALREGRP